MGRIPLRCRVGLAGLNSCKATLPHPEKRCLYARPLSPESNKYQCQQEEVVIVFHHGYLEGSSLAFSFLPVCSFGQGNFCQRYLH